MGEAKRRKRLDPNYGKVRRPIPGSEEAITAKVAKEASIMLCEVQIKNFGSRGASVLRWLELEQEVEAYWWTEDSVRQWLDSISEEARTSSYWGMRGKLISLLEHMDFATESLVIESYLKKLPDVSLTSNTRVLKLLEELKK